MASKDAQYVNPGNPQLTVRRLILSSHWDATKLPSEPDLLPAEWASLRLGGHTSHWVSIYTAANSSCLAGTLYYANTFFALPKINKYLEGLSKHQTMAQHSGTSNLWSMSHIWQGIGTNTTQHKILSLFKTYDLEWGALCHHNVKRLDTTVRAFPLFPDASPVFIF